tara:strand:+ start:3523 stop:3747 length:225 start_codon:yes stop_codon:yes gene_type:complete
MNNGEEYGNIPFRILEDVGLPFNYIELSYEQQAFVDYFLDTMTEMRDNITRLEEHADQLERELDIATRQRDFDD